MSNVNDRNVRFDLRWAIDGGVRMSLWRMRRSRLPEARRSPFQARAPTLAEWPSRWSRRLPAVTSHTWTVPRWVPTETRWPRSAHATDVTLSPSGARSHSLVTYSQTAILVNIMRHPCGGTLNIKRIEWNKIPGWWQQPTDRHRHRDRHWERSEKTSRPNSNRNHLVILVRRGPEQQDESTTVRYQSYQPSVVP